MPGITEHTLVLPEAVDPDAACAEDVPALVLGLPVPSQTTRELGRRLDALERALGPGTDPRLRERIARQLRPVLALWLTIFPPNRLPSGGLEGPHAS